MSGDYWDGSGAGVGPNLAKLPLEIREQQTRPMPLREGEAYGRVVLFRKSPGLVHPNGRVNVTVHQSDPLDVAAVAGVQIDATDFSARIPLATLILAKEGVPGVLTNLLRAYMQLGGTDADIERCIATARKAPTISMTAVVNFEEQPSNE
jgi:hypothetical protein